MKNSKLMTKHTNSLSASKNEKLSLQSLSPIHDDGTFIEDMDSTDGFSNINTMRYGEEVDVDDI